MKTLRSLLCMGLISGGLMGSAAFAQKPKATPPPAPQLTTDQRNKMADAHEKMATCLRSDRPMADCHQELMKSCQETMGEHGCPMMGGGMHHHGEGKPPAGKTPPASKTP